MNDAAGQKVPESYKRNEKKNVMDMLGVLLHKKIK